MKKKKTAVHHRIENALAGGTAPSAGELRRLRESNAVAVKAYKLSFWVAIGILNVALWVPLTLPRPLLVGAGLIAFVYAFSVPIVAIRKRQRNLEALEEVSPGPKKRRASENGQRYIETVRKEGRAFTRAEFEILDTSRAAEE